MVAKRLAKVTKRKTMKPKKKIQPNHMKRRRGKNIRASSKPVKRSYPTSAPSTQEEKYEVKEKNVAKDRIPKIISIDLPNFYSNGPRPSDIFGALTSGKPHEKTDEHVFQFIDNCLSTFLDGYDGYQVGGLYGETRWEWDKKFNDIAGCLANEHESIRSRIFGPKISYYTSLNAPPEFYWPKTISRLKYRLVCSRCKAQFVSTVPCHCVGCGVELTEENLATPEKLMRFGVTWVGVENDAHRNGTDARTSEDHIFDERGGRDASQSRRTDPILVEAVGPNKTRLGPKTYPRHELSELDADLERVSGGKWLHARITLRGGASNQIAPLEGDFEVLNKLMIDVDKAITEQEKATFEIYIDSRGFCKDSPNDVIVVPGPEGQFVCGKCGKVVGGKLGPSGSPNYPAFF